VKIQSSKIVSPKLQNYSKTVATKAVYSLKINKLIQKHVS